MPPPLRKADAMKLYMHPVSTGARPVRLMLAEHDIPCEEVFVDLMAGAHHQPPYSDINPNRLIPMLEEADGWRLTESSAILKYIADKHALHAVYPTALRERARVNEAQAACLERGQQRSQRWLKLLDEHWIGANKPYLCGDAVTIADYLGSGIVSIGELVGC